MEEVRKYPGKLVFGLDIGTRSIVGTVGYKTGDQFYVVAQRLFLSGADRNECVWFYDRGI